MIQVVLLDEFSPARVSWLRKAERQGWSSVLSSSSVVLEVG